MKQIAYRKYLRRTNNNSLEVVFGLLWIVESNITYQMEEWYSIII